MEQRLLERPYRIELEHRVTGERPHAVEFPMGIMMTKPACMEEIDAVKKVAAIAFCRYFDEDLPEAGDRMMNGDEVLFEFDPESIRTLQTCDIEVTMETADEEIN